MSDNIADHVKKWLLADAKLFATYPPEFHTGGPLIVPSPADDLIARQASVILDLQGRIRKQADRIIDYEKQIASLLESSSRQAEKMADMQRDMERAMGGQWPLSFVNIPIAPPPDEKPTIPVRALRHGWAG